MTDTFQVTGVDMTKPKPIPATPTHCTRGCGTELEPLRRYAGLCKLCVARMSIRNALVSAKPLSIWKVVREYTVKRKDGFNEKYFHIVCGCGRTRNIKADKWKRSKPKHCSRCRLKEIDKNGGTIEAESAR